MADLPPKCHNINHTLKNVALIEEAMQGIALYQKLVLDKYVEILYLYALIPEWRQ